MVNGTTSLWHDVLSGIPQVSVLGPILFFLYIITLLETTNHSKTYLFAGDTKIFKGICIEEHTCTKKLQEDIDSIYQWTDDSLVQGEPIAQLVRVLGL